MAEEVRRRKERSEEALATIFALGILGYIAYKIYSSLRAGATTTTPIPSPSPTPTPPSPSPPSPPPTPTYSLSINASKDSLTEDPNDSVTVTVCWSNYTLPPASGDYYNVSVKSDTEGCVFDYVLLPKTNWNPTSCGNFSRHFLDMLEGGNPYFPCLGVLRGCIDNSCSQNTVTVNRVLKYSINDVSGLEYDPNTGNVDLVFSKDVTNMAVIIQAWTEDANGNACRGLIDPNNTATSKGLWATSTNQRYQLFTGVQPQTIQVPGTNYTCTEKYIVVRVRRPDGYKDLRVAMG